MRMLFLVLTVGFLVLAAAPQNALACHKNTPHGAETSCGGGKPLRLPPPHTVPAALTTVVLPLWLCPT